MPYIVELPGSPEVEEHLVYLMCLHQDLHHIQFDLKLGEQWLETPLHFTIPLLGMHEWVVESMLELNWIEECPTDPSDYVKKR